MKKFSSQDGLTLIETLATLVVSTIIIIALSTILIDGFRISNSQTAKLTMQQQANYLLVVWREMQELGDPYEIILNNEKTQITFKRYDNQTPANLIESRVVTSPNYTFQVQVEGHEIATYNLRPKTTKAFTINIKLTDAADHTKQYEIETILSRL